MGTVGKACQEGIYRGGLMGPRNMGMRSYGV